MLKAVRFQVQNYRNIDGSGWIPIETVTALVGRNESGKTAVLKALHKFNPATPEPYSPQREFPRDRYTRDVADPADWPVCTVAFEIADPLRARIVDLTGREQTPKEAVCTRYYDGSLSVAFDPAIPDEDVVPAPVVAALNTFAEAARRLETPAADQEQQTQALRTTLASWAETWEERFNSHSDLRGEDGVSLLSALREESESHTGPQTASMVEELRAAIDPVLGAAKMPAPVEQVIELLEEHMPVFIYFENYGILDSAIYLPRFLEDLERAPDDPRVRTVNAMFKHVRLTAEEIAKLGQERAREARARNEVPTEEMIAQDREQKEARAIKLNSASLDISRRFNDWYGQRRHTVDYRADGDYFRIWVADERRPGVQIELEGRSKGFQWFSRSTWFFWSSPRKGTETPCFCSTSRGCTCIPPPSRN